jgi:hypothetical protein
MEESDLAAAESRGVVEEEHPGTLAKGGGCLEHG